MSLTNEIKNICNQLCDDELTKLRLEEELLITMVKSSKQRLKTKTEAFERIKAINKRQLQILGDSGLDSTFPRKTS
jgi:hypothetical protein